MHRIYVSDMLYAPVRCALDAQCSGSFQIRFDDFFHPVPRRLRSRLYRLRTPGERRLLFYISSTDQFKAWIFMSSSRSSRAKTSVLRRSSGTSTTRTVLISLRP